MSQPARSRGGAGNFPGGAPGEVDLGGGADRPQEATMTRSLIVRPATRDEANGLIARWHRHHGRVPGHRFALALEADGELVGAAVVSRPVARELADPLTAEVVRCVVREGAPNGCSKLYAAAWRAWRAMGGRRLVTYTLPEEGGASLRAAGARLAGWSRGDSWSRLNRPRVDLGPLRGKWRWEWTA